VKKLRDLDQLEQDQITGDALYVKQDEDSILLEQPKLKEDEKNAAPEISKIDTTDLTVYDKLVIQAHINYLFKSLPMKDE